MLKSSWTRSRAKPSSFMRQTMRSKTLVLWSWTFNKPKRSWICVVILLLIKLFFYFCFIYYSIYKFPSIFFLNKNKSRKFRWFDFYELKCLWEGIFLRLWLFIVALNKFRILEGKMEKILEFYKEILASKLLNENFIENIKKCHTKRYEFPGYLIKILMKEKLTVLNCNSKSQRGRCWNRKKRTRSERNRRWNRERREWLVVLI